MDSRDQEHEQDQEHEVGLVFLGYAAIRGLFFRTPRAFVDQRKTYKEWAALPREPITLDAQFFSRLQRLPLKGHTVLSAFEQTELEVAVSNLVTHANLNTFESYLKFRAPCAFELDLSRFVDEYLELAADAGIRTPTDPRDCFELYWNAACVGGVLLVSGHIQMAA